MKTLTAFLLLILLSDNTSIEKCPELKTGKFELISENGTVHLITRTENTQSESIEEIGLVSQYDIIWSSNCEYKLFNRRVIKGTDRYPEMKIDTLFCKIIEINGKSHITETSISGADFTISSTLNKIE